MTRKLVAVTLAITLVLGFSGVAQAVTGAGAISLTFPIGARYNALGEAGTALAQDATAMWWNPGGLAFLSNRTKPHDVHIMQSSLAKGLADDIGLYWGGYASPLGPTGTLGFYINYLDMGEQLGKDEGGNDTGTFSSYAFAFGAVYGVRVSSTLGLGLGVKYYRDKLAEDVFTQDSAGGSGSGDSFGVDLGLLWKVPSIRSNLAVSMANLGPDIKHVDSNQSDPMPRNITVGFATSIFQSEFMGLLAVGDLLVPLLDWKEDNWGFGADFDLKEYGGGLEWNYLQSLFIRFGYKSVEEGDISATTYGFGVDMERWVNQSITFDYAAVPQAQGLDRVDRLSLGYRF